MAEFIILSGEKYTVEADNAEAALDAYYNGEGEWMETESMVLQDETGYDTDPLIAYLKRKRLEASATVLELTNAVADAGSREWQDGDDSTLQDLGMAQGKFDAYLEIQRFIEKGGN
jgi:hypothetical protein